MIVPAERVVFMSNNHGGLSRIRVQADTSTAKTTDGEDPIPSPSAESVDLLFTDKMLLGFHASLTEFVERHVKPRVAKAAAQHQGPDPSSLKLPE